MALAPKTAKKTPKLIPQPKGKGALLSGGLEGNKGGTGRPPNWFKEFCEDLLASPDVKKQMEQVAKDKKHPQFSNLLKLIADRGVGPVPTKVEGGDKPVEHTVTVVFSHE